MGIIVKCKAEMGNWGTIGVEKENKKSRAQVLKVQEYKVKERTGEYFQRTKTDIQEKQKIRKYYYINEKSKKCERDQKKLFKT